MYLVLLKKKMTITSTQIQFILVLPLLASFLVSGSEVETQLVSNGLQVSVPLQDANGSLLKVTSWSTPILGTTMNHDEIRRGSSNISVANTSTQMPKTMRSCRVTKGLCDNNCLTGCCDQRCSKRFKNGVGKCIEPMLPTAPCVCQYTC
ncbi:hypothetical protein LXL04_017267 [Taraxacum kok-saghyz]